MRSRSIFLLAFLTAFGAGLSVGLLWQRSSSAEKPPPPQQPPQDGWLSELNLTPDQREKIKAIWTDAMKTGNWQQQREKREAAQAERDEALQALMSAGQKPKYEEILAAYQKKVDELNAESKKSRDAAYEKTKTLLSETQRVQYDELRKKRFEGRGRRPEPGKTPPAGAEKKSETELKKPDVEVKRKDE